MKNNNLNVAHHFLIIFASIYLKDGVSELHKTCQRFEQKSRLKYVINDFQKSALDKIFDSGKKRKIAPYEVLEYMP